MLLRLATLLLYLPLMSCSTLLRTFAEEPVVRLKTIKVKNFSFTKVEFALEAEIENPNGFAIGLNHLDYEVFMKSKKIGFGTYKEPFKVPSHEKASFQLPFAILPDATIAVAKSFFVGGGMGLDAKVVGVAEISLPIGSYDLHFNETKTIIKDK